MTMNPPEQIYIQWYGEDDGNDIGIDRPEGPTFAEYRVYDSDVPYVPLARAEAAEGELESALAVVDLYQRRMFEAEARVTELEAELAAIKAAGQWRRASEPPTEDAPYLVHVLPMPGQREKYDVIHWIDAGGGWEWYGNRIDWYHPITELPQE